MADERRREAVVADVRGLTRLLRTGDGWLWLRLRAIAQDRGLSLQDGALAFSVEQGDDSEFGVIVARHGDVYEYSIVKGGEEEWGCLPDWAGSPYGDEVAVAFELLQQELL